MRCKAALAIAAGFAMFVMSAPASSIAGGENPDGFGIYSPVDKPVRGRARVYRYDPRSWYYKQRGYYPYYASAYWVPRREMRYRYRYVHYGPKFQYYPAWGYPLACTPYCY
jgi:hypothetical protein